MDLTSFLPDSAMGYVNLGAIIVAAGSLFAGTIARATKNKTDDKIAGYLKKAHDLLGMVGLHPTLDQKRAGASVPLAPRPRVVDHRAPK